MEHWKSRYNVRRFYEDRVPPQQDISAIADIVKYVPSQESKIDHFWFLLTPEHAVLKQWLLDNVFYYLITDADDAFSDEDMIQVITAPYMFLCVNTMLDGKHQLFARRNSGIVFGALMAEALRLGYDTSAVGCTRGMNASGRRVEVCEEFTEKLYETFSADKLSIMDPYRDGGRVVPYMALCVGHGMPLEEQVPGELDYYNLADYGDKKYAPFQKPKKPVNNIII